MTSNFVDFLSVGAQCVGAMAAVLGLRFIGNQVREGRRASDLQTLQAFLKDTREHERAFTLAGSNEEKKQAFIEFLNFLETYAAVLNSDLPPEVSKGIIGEKLRDSLAVIQNAEDWHEELQNAITSDTTFKELMSFYAANKQEILALATARRS